MALHQHLLVEFALTLLHGALRKGLINPRAPGAGAARARNLGGPAADIPCFTRIPTSGPSHCACLSVTISRPRQTPLRSAAELLDPLLPLLVRALRSRHAPSVTSALQSLALLMQSPLPGLAKTAAGVQAGRRCRGCCTTGIGAAVWQLAMRR